MTIWSGARACLLGATMTAACLLTGCFDGGGDEDRDQFEVAVKVDGVADASNPMTDGESTTISVPSGSILAFESEADTTWTQTATDSTFEVTSSSMTSKSLSVTSYIGGKLVIVFADKADATKTATLTVNVAPKEFQQVARVDGEVERWSTATTWSTGEVEHYDTVRRTDLLDDGYAVEFLSVDTGSVYSRLLYDSHDSYLGTTRPDGSFPCIYDQPVVNQVFPLHVGSTWNGQASRSCVTGDTTRTYTRTVEAYEQVVVAEGQHDALRIKSVETFSLAPVGLPPFTDTITSTCWWAVDLGRHVKCNHDHAPSDGAPYTSTEELTSLTR
jgi:hypothetical protein